MDLREKGREAWVKSRAQAGRLELGGAMALLLGCQC